MKYMKKLIVFTCFALLGMGQVSTGTEKVKKPYTVVFQTTPFGSNGYNIGAAFEQVFMKTGSWVHIKQQETPGAMYILKYMKVNQKKFKSGELPPVIGTLSIGMLPFVREGRQFLKKLAQPNMVALLSTPAYFSFYGSFNSQLRDLKDFSGHKVGAAERSRVFQGVLLDKPLFAKGVGNYDKIEWFPLGSLGCKDGLLNGRIDAARFRFLAKVSVNKTGGLIFTAAVPDPATMELLNSGRAVTAIPTKATYIQNGYDYSKDLMVLPSVLKKGVVKSIDHDMEVGGDIGIIISDNNLPKEVAEEILRVRHEYKQEFGKYHAALKFFPDTPYPLAVPREMVHPGTISGMKKLGLTIPKVRLH